MLAATTSDGAFPLAAISSVASELARAVLGMSGISAGDKRRAFREGGLYVTWRANRRRNGGGWRRKLGARRRFWTPTGAFPRNQGGGVVHACCQLTRRRGTEENSSFHQTVAREDLYVVGSMPRGHRTNPKATARSGRSASRLPRGRVF